MTLIAIGVDGSDSEPADTVYTVPDHIDTVFAGDAEKVILPSPTRLARQLVVVANLAESTVTVETAAGEIKGPEGFAGSTIELGDEHRFSGVTFIFEGADWHIV